ncbi:hypothetical protein Tco_1027825 [Tanacetum coccineum]
MAMKTVKFKAPPPMSGLTENRNKNKFCEFYGDKGHSTDECIHLKKQIKEATPSENQKTNDPSHDLATRVQQGNILAVKADIANGVIRRRGTLYNSYDGFHDRSVSLFNGSGSQLLPNELAVKAWIKIAIHPEYQEQTITIGGILLEKGRMELYELFISNLDVFA